MSPSLSDDQRHFANPFGRLVGDPLADSVDVPDINVGAFEACRRLILQVREQRASAALTLNGEAGAGKTHLLGRVRRWLQSVPQSLFVPVRMDTSAQMIWRHLRRNLADALLRPNPAGSRAIDELLGPRLAEVALLPERDLAIVLENLLHGTNARDTAAWLRGQDLPEAVLQKLELAHPGADESYEDISRNIVVALCSLIDPGTVVLCLDQWEALQSYAADLDGLLAAGQAVSFLHDKVPNVSIICCLQTGSLPKLENTLDVAIRQRMMGNRGAIELLDWDKATRLIAALLDASSALSELRHTHGNPLWPLSEKPIREIFLDGEAPARKVISRCKDLFDLWRTGVAEPKVPLDAALRSMLDDRTANVSPQDSSTTLRDGLPEVFHALGSTLSSPGGNSPFDFVFPAGQTIAICNQSSRSLESRLRKIKDAWLPGAGPLILLRDARLPIGAGAKLTRLHLDTLESQGGQFVRVSQEAIEALAALHRLLADAKSGDLDHGGDAIPVNSVEQWIAGNLPGALDPLIAAIRSPNALAAKLADLLAQRKIISLDEAARELHSRPAEVESCARRDPRLFGFLGGASPALFLPASTPDGTRFHHRS